MFHNPEIHTQNTYPTPRSDIVNSTRFLRTNALDTHFTQVFNRPSAIQYYVRFYKILFFKAFSQLTIFQDHIPNRVHPKYFQSSPSQLFPIESIPNAAHSLKNTDIFIFSLNCIFLYNSCIYSFIFQDWT